MDILSWNIKFGGQSRLDAIESRIVARRPAIVVIGEYVRGVTEPLIERLSEAGWPHHILPDPPDRRGGVAIVSRLPLLPQPAPVSMSEGFRYAAVTIPTAHLELRGIYGPLDGDPYHEFWEALLHSLEEESAAPVLVVGDLNACLPRVDTTATELFSEKYFERLSSCGYTDLWRAMNDSAADICTWQGPMHPYRLDHAFGTAAIVSRVRSCIYDHSVRLAGLSDHSMLSVTLDAAEEPVI